MSILCHMALFLYSIVGIAISFVATGLYLKVFSNEWVWNQTLFIANRFETPIVIAVYFLFSIYLLVKSLSSKKKVDKVNSDALTVTGNLGNVQVSLDALKDVAIKLANSISGVRDVKIKMKIVTSSSDKNMNIPCYDVKLTVGETDNIVVISDKLKGDILEYLNKYVSIGDALINIAVVTISQSPVNGKKRVV